MRFRVDNNNLRSVSIVEITTEQSDSVRINYVLRDDDTVMFRIVPFDANRGVLSSVAFHLDNNEVPVVYFDSIGVIVGG